MGLNAHYIQFLKVASDCRRTLAFDGGPWRFSNNISVMLPSLELTASTYISMMHMFYRVPDTTVDSIDRSVTLVEQTSKPVIGPVII